MRKLILLAFLLFIMSATYAEFLLEHVDVVISDIQEDGSAHAHESIKMIVTGNYSTSLYDSGLSLDRLSFWSANTQLKDVKLHINPSTVDIKNLRIRPQPRTKCNPIQGFCHGEIILDYIASPNYNGSSSGLQVNNTGIFSVSQNKPRTHRYTLNPAALSFITSPEGNILLGDQVVLTIRLPTDSVVQDVNPQPTSGAIELPGKARELSWSDIVLVKFSFIMDKEDGIDKEVTDFFTRMLSGIIDALRGPQGLALIVLVALVAGSYIYIITAKRRGEE